MFAITANRTTTCTRILNYPGHIVNCSLELTTGKTTGKEVARLFNRPYMGGLDRLGILAKGIPGRGSRGRRSRSAKPPQSDLSWLPTAPFPARHPGITLKPRLIPRINSGAELIFGRRHPKIYPDRWA